MDTFSISREGYVRDRETGRELGLVQRIEMPRQADNGQINTDYGWEARKPHEVLINSPYAFGFYAA